MRGYLFLPARSPSSFAEPSRPDLVPPSDKAEIDHGILSSTEGEEQLRPPRLITSSIVPALEIIVANQLDAGRSAP